MRLKLSLSTSDKLLPVNYYYYLSSAIYNLLQFGSPQFASFIHDIGFKVNGKPFKLFCFSLRFNNFLISGNRIKLLSHNASLFISSPLVDQFITNLILGSFENNSVELADSIYKCRFTISSVETLPNPSFNQINYFTLLSPIVLSTKKDKSGGSLSQYFFRYSDDIQEINRVFNNNLKSKYFLIHQKEYIGPDLILSWDQDYINKKIAAGKRLTKKISIIKPNEKPIDIIANEVPFSLSGPVALIEAGYNCGFGEKNSMGFGLADII